MAPGSPPTDAVFIVLIVITAASVMQAAGGIDWMVGVAARAIARGMPKGSYCPHYDAEDQRRPLFHRVLLEGTLARGYASWNRAAIRFDAEGTLVEAVTSEKGGRALKVSARNGRILEEEIPAGTWRRRPPALRSPPDHDQARALPRPGRPSRAPQRRSRS